MITQERLKELVEYDPETGVMRWIKLTGMKGYIGKPVGSSHSGGYLEASIDKRRNFVHRFIWLYMTGEWPGQIDHINGIRHDNRWENLRKATQKQNSGNMKMRPNNKAGLKGVTQYRNRFRSYIHVNGKTKYLGSFLSKEEAHMIYLQAAKVAFGDYARAK